MAIQAFGRVKAAVFVAADPIRKSIVEALESQGFRDVLEATTVAGFTAILKDANLDFIITTTRLESQFTGGLIRDLRLGLFDSSPFPIVFALLPHADEEHVRAVINSGVDDLLLLPLAADALIKRIKLFTQDRRPFVVTYDYIGPDRRQNTRPNENKALVLKVPNPVRSRVVGVDDEGIEHAINDAIVLVNRCKLKQNGLQLLWLLARLAIDGEDGNPTDAISVNFFMSNCRDICADIDQRAKGSAERAMRMKAMLVSETIDRIAASDDGADKRQLMDLTRAVDDLVDYISAYHGEQLKL